MYVGALNHGSFSGMGKIIYVPQYISSLPYDELVKYLEAMDKGETLPPPPKAEVEEEKEPPKTFKSLAELYAELAKYYDVTDIDEEDFSCLRKDLYNNGLITATEYLYSGGVFLHSGEMGAVDPKKDHYLIFKGERGDTFNAAKDYASSYADYVQKNAPNNANLKEAVLAHNKIGEILNAISQYSSK